MTPRILSWPQWPLHAVRTIQCRNRQLGITGKKSLARRLVWLFWVLSAVTCYGQGAITGCAAFLRDGTPVRAVVLPGAVRVDVGRSGSPVSLPMAIKPTSACKVSVSADQKLAAVLLYRDKPGMQVVVVDLAKKSWLRPNPSNVEFATEPAGFVANQHAVVAVSVGSGDPYIQQAGLFPMVLDADTGSVNAEGRNVPYRRNEVAQQFLDPRNNRLWVQRADGSCGMESKTLIGEWRKGPTVNADAVDPHGCHYPSLALFPERQTAVIGSGWLGNVALWRVDMQSKQAQQLVVSQDKDRYLWLKTGGEVSADGRVIGIPVWIMKKSTMRGLSKDGEGVAIVQVTPFKFVGVATTQCEAASFAIDHRGGKTTIVEFCSGQWREESLND